MSDYAWIITRDHLAEAERKDSGKAEDDGAGITGPSDAPDDLLERLNAGEGHTFKLYDDDGELYYTGRILTTGDMAQEEHCFAPLDDFGMGYAGCTAVKYPGHPEWDCG